MVATQIVAFAILKDAQDIVARQAVRARKHIGPSLVYMDQPLAERCDPEAAVAIAEQLR